MSNARAALFRGRPRSQRSRSHALIPVPGKQPSQRRNKQPSETRSAWRPSKNALTGSSLISSVTPHACRRRVSRPKRSELSHQQARKGGFGGADWGEYRKAAGAFAEVIGVNTESAYRPWSTDVVRAGAGIGYCADRTRQSRSRYLNTVEML